MANDPANSNFAFGAPRSTPRVSDLFSNARPLAKNPIGNFSSAPLSADELGTGAYVNGAMRRPSRRRGIAADLSLGKPAGPLSGLEDAQAEIFKAANVGPDRRGIGLMRSTYSKDNYAEDEPGWATGSAPTDADPERPPTTPADLGGPLLNASAPSSPHPATSTRTDR